MNTIHGSSARGISAFGQLGVLIGLVGLGFILAAVVTIAIPIFMLRIPFSQLQSALFDPKNIQTMRLVQFASTFVLFALPALGMAGIVYGKPVQYLRFNSYSTPRQFFIVLLLVIAALFAQSIITQINEIIPIPASWQQAFKRMEDDYAKEVMAMAQMKSFADYLYALTILAFLPAMFEEMFFRGALQQTLVRLFRSPMWGIIITSILFSAAHASYYGFLARFFLGVLLGYIFHYGKNIWLNITGHFLNNAIVVTSLYMLSRSGKLTGKSLDDQPYPVYVGVFALVSVIALFVFFKRESLNNDVVNNNKIAEEQRLTAANHEKNDDPQQIEF